MNKRPPKPLIRLLKNETETKSSVKKTDSLIVDNTAQEPEELLPFVGPPLHWYEQRGIKAAANIARAEARMSNQVIRVNRENKYLVRENAIGNLSDDINTIIDKLSHGGSKKHQEHLRTLISIAKYILDNGPVAKTQELVREYKKIKMNVGTARIKATSVLETISKS